MKLWQCAATTVLVSTLLILNGCDKDNTPPPTPLSEVTPNALGVHTLWRNSTGDGTNNRYLSLAAEVVGNTIYTVSQDGTIQATNRLNGNTLWSIDVDYPLSTTPVVAQQQLFVGTLNGYLLAVDLKTQKIQWHKQLSSTALSQPAVTQHDVIIHTHDGNVTAYERQTAKQLWQFTADTPDLTLERDSSPVVDGSNVVVGLSNDQIAVLSLSNGKVQWQRPIALPAGNNAVSNMVDVVSTPIVVDGTIYTVSYNGNIVSLQEHSGQLNWQHPASSFDNMAYNDNTLYLTDAQGQVMAVDADSGKTLWVQNKFKYRFVSPPAASCKVVMVGDFAGYLHFLSTNNGKDLARLQPLDSGVRAQPVVVGNTFYVTGNEGGLVAVSA